MEHIDNGHSFSAIPLLGKRVKITKEVEEKYGIYIDIHTEIPLVIGYGEVRVFHIYHKTVNYPVQGGLCFSISDFYYSSTEGTWIDKPHSISLWLGHRRPKLSFLKTPFTEKQAKPKSRGMGRGSPYAIERELIDFFQTWSKSEKALELRGDEENLRLYVYIEPKYGVVLEIKLLSKRDFYTVAGWFILMAANKYIWDEEQAPIFEEYWPSCRYYRKPLVSKDTVVKPTDAERNTFLYPTYKEDLSLRENNNPLPFNRLLMLPFIGYYDENGEPQFYGNANIVNVQYDDGILKFDSFSDDTTKLMNSIHDFSFSPIQVIVEEKGEKADGLSYLQDDPTKTNKIDSEKAELVNAPYYTELPIVLECRLFKREGQHYSHFEAIVFKTRISKAVCDEEGKINMIKACPHMIWIQKMKSEENKSD